MARDYEFNIAIWKPSKGRCLAVDSLLVLEENICSNSFHGIHIIPGRPPGTDVYPVEYDKCCRTGAETNRTFCVVSVH